MAFPEVLVVGAGLAGLTATRVLREAGVDVALLESADAPGGRVRTDRIRGFSLDRGFQVLATAYPHLRRYANLEALDVQPFRSGVLLRRRGRTWRLFDPRIAPREALSGLAAPFGKPLDLVRLLRWASEAGRGGPGRAFDLPERTAIGALRSRHFSDAMVERLFRPFFGTVLADRELQASGRLLDFAAWSFLAGPVGLPAEGMGALPAQLAAGLPAGTLQLDTPIVGLRRLASSDSPDRSPALGGIEARSADGGSLRADVGLVATDGPSAAQLVPTTVSDPGSRGTTCVYFASDRPPYDEPVVCLDGDGDGPVDLLAVPTNVAPTYGPPGGALLSATVLSPRGAATSDLVAAVRDQLTEWFGRQARGLEHLATYRIRHAQPASTPRPPRVADAGRELAVCGDHLAHASIEGAMAAGEAGARGVAARLLLAEDDLDRSVADRLRGLLEDGFLDPARWGTPGGPAGLTTTSPPGSMGSGSMGSGSMEIR